MNTQETSFFFINAKRKIILLQRFDCSKFTEPNLKIPEDDTESKACEVNDDRHKNDLDNLCHHQNHNHRG